MTLCGNDGVSGAIAGEGQRGSVHHSEYEQLNLGIHGRKYDDAVIKKNLKLARNAFERLGDRNFHF